MDIEILCSAVVDGTYDEHYCLAKAGATSTPGVARWVRTTSAQTAAQQATAIRNGLTV